MARPPSTIYKIRRALWRRKLITLPILAASVVLFCALAILIPRLEKASEEKKRAEQKVTSIKTEKEIKDRESAQREAAFKKARPYLDEAHRIRLRIDRQLMNKNAHPGSFVQLFEEGKALLETALEIYPSYAEAYLEIARLAEISGYPPSDCIVYFSRAIEADPQLITGYLERIQVLLWRYYQARFSNQLLQRVPSTAESKAIIDRIKADVEKIRRWSKDLKELKFSTGMILMVEAKYDEASVPLREYAEETISDHRAWKWLALTEIGRGNLEEAIVAIGKGILYRPWDFSFYSIRQYVRTKQAEEFVREGLGEKAAAMWKLSLDDAKIAHRIKGDEKSILTNLAWSLEFTGDLEGALKVYEKALKLDPKIKSARKSMGAIQVKLGNMEAAIREFSLEILSFPEDGGSYYNRAKVYSKMGRHDEAMADLDIAVKRSPNLPTAWGMRGNLRVDRKDYGGALEDFRRALKVAPGNWKYRANVEKAVRKLEKFLEKE